VDKLLTAKQLSELLQVNQSTVYKWSHMEFIPHVKMGKAVRFVESEVETWLRQRSRQGRKTMRYNVEDSQ
jgi:excisionase family DNA binding protein